MEENRIRNNTTSYMDSSKWKSILKICVIFSILTVLSIVSSIAAFFIWPPFPEDILNIIHKNHFVGIMSLDFLYLVSVVFTLPLIIAFYITLKQSNEVRSLFALVSGLLGVVFIFAARPIIEMISISEKFALVNTELERTMLLASEKTLLEQFNGTAYYAHILFGNISFLISSFLMYKSKVFTKGIAITGIITNTIAFGILVPVIGPFFGFIFLLGFIPWLVLISVRLLIIINNR